MLLERVLAAIDPADPDAARATQVLTGASKAAADTARPPAARLAALESPEVTAVLARPPAARAAHRRGPLPGVRRPRPALFGSWYEFFPRSEGATKDAKTGKVTSGTFQTAAKRLDAVAAMGFDVVYLPPIHPIGEVNRKGPNNTLDPGPDDPGSPWAIGSADGGHDAIHPDLGTFDDFDAFVARRQRARPRGRARPRAAGRAGPPVGDRAPRVVHHPRRRHDRVRREPAEEVPGHLPDQLRQRPERHLPEVLRIVRLWMSHGVRIFRVDNPHTKPVAFWEWLLGEVRRTDPDVLFLSEAFTRPAMMRGLGAVGFHQSYTYFTWRNAKWEIEEYLTRAVPRDRPPDAAELLRQHARHPARLPAVRRPGGVQDPRGASPRPGRRAGACTPASSCSSTSRCGPAARSTSTRRSTRSGSATGPPPRPRGARSRRTSPGSTRSAARTRRCSGCAT